MECSGSFFIELCFFTYAMICNILFDPNQNCYTASERATFLSYEQNNLTAINPSNVSSWVDEKPICFVIPGWREDNQTAWVTKLIKTYEEKRLCHVIVVDWWKRAAANYPTAANNTHTVGDCLGEFLMEIIRGGFPSEKIYLVGHSLGAHIAGFAGKIVTNRTGKTIGTIIGLDPAAPLFWFSGPTDRLNGTDAKLVLVYSTNQYFFGTFWQWGHVTIVVNSGFSQPGCPFYYLNYSKLQNCSHQFSAIVYIYSIQNPFNLKAGPCSCCSYYPCDPFDKREPVYVSFNPPRNITGYYYANTGIISI